MNRDNPRVRLALSIIGLVFIVASLVMTFWTGSMVWGYGLLLVALAPHSFCVGGVRERYAQTYCVDWSQWHR